METKEQYFKKIAIPLAKQSAMIDQVYPNFKTEITSKGELISIGHLKPMPLSKNYLVKISYILWHSPKVEIVNLDLNNNSEKPPHVYEKGNLCLFYPRYKEWTVYDYIADTIIPWTSEWLYYYEIWSITGEWKGGGKHPESNKKIKKLDSNIY